MGYELIIDENKKTIEIHSDVCDELLSKKEDIKDEFYVGFNLYDEVEHFLETHKEYEIVECKVCKPSENKEILDEEYDDFYEEFAEDDDIDSTRCDIF